MATRRMVFAVTAGLALLAVAYTLWKVRAGRWAHVDASHASERRTLNGMLMAILFGAALLLWQTGAAPGLPIGLALAGALVLLGHLLRRWLKLSLHVACAVFAAILFWPQALAVGGGLLLAGGVAWSRLELARHTRTDIVAGLLAGLLAGAAFKLLVR